MATAPAISCDLATAPIRSIPRRRGMAATVLKPRRLGRPAAPAVAGNAVSPAAVAATTPTARLRDSSRPRFGDPGRRFCDR